MDPTLRRTVGLALLVLVAFAPVAAPQLQGLELGADILLVELFDISDNIRFEDTEVDLAGIVPADAVAIYVEIRGQVRGGDMGDTTGFAVRLRGVDATERALAVDNNATDPVLHWDYVWLPLEPGNQVIQYAVAAVSPPEFAEIEIRLKGWITGG